MLGISIPSAQGTPGWGFPIWVLQGRWWVPSGGAVTKAAQVPSAVGQDGQRWGSITSGQEGSRGGQDSQGGYNQPCCIGVTGMED